MLSIVTALISRLLIALAALLAQAGIDLPPEWAASATVVVLPLALFVGNYVDDLLRYLLGKVPFLRNMFGAA